MFSLGLIIKSGLAIGGLTTIPLVTKALIDSGSSKYSVSETGDLIGPIFDCYKDKNNYKVYLVPNIDNWSKTGEQDKHIALRIVEKKGNNPEQVVWSFEENNENKWSQWDIHFLGRGEIKLLSNSFAAGGFGQGATCSNSKVDLKNGRNYETFWSVADKKENIKTKFKVDLRACGERKECDIIFAEDSKFQWSSGFQPKFSIPLSKR